MAKVEIVDVPEAQGPNTEASKTTANKMPKIVLNMIVKNEESNLPQNFARVKGLVDAIVLLDTGSTDETINKA